MYEFDCDTVKFRVPTGEAVIAASVGEESIKTKWHSKDGHV